MAVIPEITCRRCGKKYSGLKRECPYCNALRTNQPTRVPPTTASVTPKTAASMRQAADSNMRLILVGILALAVVIAVFVLMRTGNKETSAPGAAVPGNTTQNGASFIAADLPTPSPSPVPTPDATPTPVIDSMAITFLNKTISNHSMTLSLPGQIFNVDLDVSTYPAADGLTVTWKSTNESIITVDQRGFINVVGASPNRTVHAGVVASCGGLEDYVTVYIPAFQAAYLTENLFNADTYDADNLEWDTFIYASPTPKA